MKSRSISNPHCHLCGDKVIPINDESNSGFVTSDCQPVNSKAIFAYCHNCFVVQKRVNIEWQQTVNEIYNSYKVYEQGKGKEQQTFDFCSGIGKARSKLIAEWVKNQTNKLRPSLLDIGCGNGSFLREFRRVHPYSELYGSELNETNRTIVEQIENCKFISSSMSSIKQKFDLVSLIHVLEHITDPESFLRQIHKKIRKDGYLIVEVPNLEESPFDLFIFDHCTHFTTGGVQKLLAKSGFKIKDISTNVVSKEISIIAEPLKKEQTSTMQKIEQTVNPPDIAMNHLKLAHKLKMHAKKSYDNPVYIFGSSISATWLAHELNFDISGFVEEDMNRVGNKHCGIHIYAPSSIEERSMLLLPFSSEKSKLIAARLSSKYPLLCPLFVN